MIDRLEKETAEVRTEVDTQRSAPGSQPDKDTEDAVDEAEEDIEEARANEERAEEIAQEAERKMLDAAENEVSMKDVSSEILAGVDTEEAPAAAAFDTTIDDDTGIDFTQIIAT